MTWKSSASDFVKIPSRTVIGALLGTERGSKGDKRVEYVDDGSSRAQKSLSISCTKDRSSVRIFSSL